MVTLDYPESGNPSLVSCGLNSQMPKKKVANGFKRGIQVFFAAMVCLVMMGPVSVFAAEQVESSKFPGCQAARRRTSGFWRQPAIEDQLWAVGDSGLRWQQW